MKLVYLNIESPYMLIVSNLKKDKEIEMTEEQKFRNEIKYKRSK